MPEQNTDPRAPAQPMSPERLNSIRQHVTGGGDGLCKSEARDLLADRDHLAAELEVARALADEWRSGMCSRAELADPANGFAFPWESSGAGS